jgi:hypothetical protein
VTQVPAHDEGGDDACWIEQVCDRCGGFIDPAESHVCRHPVRSRQDSDHQVAEPLPGTDRGAR